MSDRGARGTPLEATAPAPEAVEELEQKETKETKEEESVAEADAGEAVETIGRLTPPARQEADRQTLAQRIRESSQLPPGLRTRLAEVAGAGGGVEEVVRAVEEALPGVLRLSERDVARPRHPAGEVFFRGDADALSDEQAETIARGQLARSGMLRGQRVAVGD